MFKILLILPFLMSTGCVTSNLVKRPQKVESSEYGPVNDISNTGVVKYLNGGASFIVKQRRQAAYKQMYNSCENGKYEIVSEGPNTEFGGFEYWYINYKCVE